MRLQIIRVALVAGAMLLAASVAPRAATLDIPFLAGSGNTNINFVIDRNNDGHDIEVGIKAKERFFGELPLIGNTYIAQPGESPTSGAPGAPADPGTTTWNFDWSVDVGAGKTLSDYQVNLLVDFDPVIGNTNLAVFDLTAVAGGEQIYQDSQNIGFGFWQLLGVANVLPIDPFAPGEYALAVEVLDLQGTRLARADALVNVVPVPAALPLLGTALLGLGVLVRRRRSAATA